MTELKRTSPLFLGAVWIIVTLPLSWGLYNTTTNSMKLFANPAVGAQTEISLPSRAKQ